MSSPRRFAVISLFAIGCTAATPEFAALPATPAAPAGAESTPERVALGRALFWDPVLSGGRDVACASCHHPDLAYADGRPQGAGAGWVGLGPKRRRGSASAFPGLARNSPTVLNAAFNGYVDAAAGLPSPLEAPMFWDSRAKSLETQAGGPIQAGAEMRGNAYPEDEAHAVVVARLQEIPEYVRQFDAAWGSGPITKEHLVASIAAFERTLVVGETSFDRYLKGDRSALNGTQRRGLDEFQNSGCTSCHSGPMLSDYQLHDLGIETGSDAGDGEGRFRTPSLRGVTLTAPYFHDGSRATLADVVRTYHDIERGELPADRRDDALDDLDVNENDAAAIAAFLGAASDGTFDRTIPARVPSGLEVGGRLSP